MQEANNTDKPAKGQESHLGNLIKTFEEGRSDLPTIKDYPFFDSIMIDMNGTVDSFKAYGHKASYSKLKEFYQADCLWLFKNHVKTPAEGAQIVETPAKEGIMGTFIQRLMEIFINHRIYSLDSMKTMDDINAWATRNLIALFDLCLTSPDRIQPSTARWYVRKDGGADDLAKALKNGLGLEFKNGNKPIFAYKEEVFKDFSKEDYLKKIIETFNNGIFAFHKQGINPDQMLSEIFLSYDQRQGMAIAGGVDFLYSPGVRRLSNIKEAKSGYHLIDGKFNVAAYTDPWQLYLYTALIALNHRIQAGQVSFLNWNTGAFTDWQIPSDSTNVLFGATDVLKRVTEETAKQTQFYIGGTPTVRNVFPNVKMKPGYSTCRFCKISKVCPASKFNEKNEQENKDRAILKNQLSNLIGEKAQNGMVEISF